MKPLFGEYDCTIDAKGRLRMPATLLRQLEGPAPYRFFLNRGFENCLMLYPERVWDRILERINDLDLNQTEVREFIRYFFRGVSNVSTDSAERILLNKGLLEYAGIQKDVTVFAYLDRIEIWDQKTYAGLLDKAPDNFARLAEKVLGKSSSL